MLGAGPQHSPRPSCACLGPSSLLTTPSSLLRATGRAHQGPSMQRKMPGFSKGHDLLLSSSSSFLFVVIFWRKSPGKCPPPLALSLLCPLLPAPLELLVPLVPIHWDNWCGGSRSCRPIVPVALKTYSLTSGEEQRACTVQPPRHPLPQPRILRGCPRCLFRLRSAARTQTICGH